MEVSTLIEETRKATANPGGGAIIILTANLATNLILMMDKNEWKDLEDQANVSRETILKTSESLSKLMQDDIDNFNLLMDKIKEGKDSEDDYLRAASALTTMVDLNLKTLDILRFYLENGKKVTLTDGEIANNLILETTRSAIPTIRLNIKDYDGPIEKAQKLYRINQDIIERRKKWQEFMLF